MWGIPAFGGFLLGTQEGEWLVQATQQGEPLTPSSIQAHMNTSYGSEFIDPKPAGLSFMFVQRFARKVLELILDVFTQKSVATNISLPARDLIKSGVLQIAYQRERTPVLWAVQNSGQLVGTTYRRDSPYGTTPAAFNAWHQHQQGANRQFVGLTAAASPGGEVDAVTVVTWDGVNANGYSLEVLTDIFEVGAPLTDACFLDYSTKPLLVAVTTVGGVQGVTLYGYYYLAGQTVQVWGAGLDLGDYTVSATGTIFVPFGADATYNNGFFSPGTFGAYSPGLFTEALLSTLANAGSTFNNLGVFVSNGNPSSGQQQPSVAAIGEYFTGHNYSTGGVANGTPDWKNNLLYVAGGDGSGQDGMGVYNITSMAPTAGKTQTQIMGGTGADDGMGQGCVGQDGFMYYSSTSGNSGAFAKLDQNLNLIKKFGVSSGDENSTNGGIARPYSLGAVFAGYQYIVQSALLSGHALSGGTGTELTIIDGTNMKWVASYGSDQATAPVCAGRQTNDGQGHFYGEAYALTNDYTVFLESATGITTYNKNLSLWRVAINESPPQVTPATSFTNLASISPESVDATWHCWNGQNGGMVFDQADNNVITVVQTGDPVSWAGGNDFILHQAVLGSNNHLYVCILASGSNTDPTGDAGVHWQDKGAYVSPTNKYYLVKFNSSTGAVIWKLAIASNPIDNQWGTSDVNGKLALHDSSTTVRFVDTIAGTMNTLTLANAGPQGQQRWGPTGLISAIDYTDSGGPPTPVPLAPCTGSFTNHWGLFAAVPTTANGLFGPFVVGYTYPTKGQTLRVVDPEASGSRTGPALGKTRKIAECAWLVADTSGVSFGVDFDIMRPAELKSAGPQSVQPMAADHTYTDIVWDKVDSDWNFDSMPCWQVTRPYPCTVVAVEGFQSTSDR